MNEMMMVSRGLMERLSELFPEGAGNDGSGRIGFLPHVTKTVDELRALLAATPVERQEPIYQVQYLGDGGGGWADAEKDSYDAKVPHPKHWRTRIVFASPPAQEERPVRVEPPAGEVPPGTHHNNDGLDSYR